MISNVGLVFCYCPQAIKLIDFHKLHNDLKNYEGVSNVVLHKEICKDPSIIRSFIRSMRFEAMIIVGCSLYREVFKNDAESAGLNPLLIEVLPIRELLASKNTELSKNSMVKLELMIMGLIEKMRRMDSAKNVMPRRISPELKFTRRMLLRGIPQVPQVYVPTPIIERDRCIGTQACDSCIKHCPKNALKDGGNNKLIIDADNCDVCGVCTSICPTGAIQIPNATDEQLIAEMRIILTKFREEFSSKILMFIDHEDYNLLVKLLYERKLSLPVEIFPIYIPSLALLSEVTILSAINFGAAGIIFINSRHNARRLEYLKVLNQKLMVVKEILSATNYNTDWLLLIEFDNEHLEQLLNELTRFVEDVQKNQWYNEDIVESLSHENRRYLLVQLIKSIFRNNKPTKDIIDYEGPCPFGEVIIDKQKCTLCEVCVNNCPMDALSLSKDDSTVSIGFIYQKCVGCKLCTSLCPENAIMIKRYFSISRLLSDTPSMLVSQELMKCSRCGRPFITEGKLRKLSSIYSGLGPQSIDKIQALRLCAECRRSKIVPAEYDKWFIYR